MRAAHSTTAITVAALVLLTAACGSAADANVAAAPSVAASSAPATSPSPSVTVANADTDTDVPAPAGDLVGPAWALTPVSVGEELAATTVGGLSVRITQAGVTAATDTGQFADESGKPIIAVGDELVVVNWTVTNTTDAAVPLGFSLVDVEATYDDWPYLQGMDSVVDTAVFDAVGVHADAFAYPAASGLSTFVLEPGQSYSAATNFRHQADSPIQFRLRFTPIDAAGEANYDATVETTVPTQIR